MAGISSRKTRWDSQLMLAKRLDTIRHMEQVKQSSPSRRVFRAVGGMEYLGPDFPAQEGLCSHKNYVTL